MGFIKNFEALATSESRRVVLELVEAAFAAIQPEEEIQRTMSLSGTKLRIEDQVFDLAEVDRLYLVGFGKGSAGIAVRLEAMLGVHLTDGWVIDASEQDFQKIHFTLGTHPLPSQANLDFTKTVVESLQGLTERDMVIVVTCGGGSAMFEYPNRLDLAGIVAVNKALLHSGATISEMNAVRKHLSRVKGGGLAKALYPATIVNLLFSDVPGNDLAVIASGPTVADPTTIEETMAIVQKYKLDESLSLEREDFEETPKDARYFSHLHNLLIVSNRSALSAMQQRAEKLGYAAEIFSDHFQGTAQESGKKLLDACPAGHILLAGGETTVKVVGEGGEGGRNQEVVLGSLPDLKEGEVLVSFDSDGWDNSPVAGVIGDTQTVKKAQEKGLNPDQFLQEHNSLAFWEGVADTIDTGRLPSNVSDLFIVLRP